jgi:hypothetical protein
MGAFQLTFGVTILAASNGKKIISIHGLEPGYLPTPGNPRKRSALALGGIPLKLHER